MRRKHLILASCIISALLLTFTFHVSADENVEVDAGASSNSAPLLDSYFWDNYDLLPYIESDGTQYISTGILPSISLETNISFSNLVDESDTNNYVFGSTRVNNYYSLYYKYLSGQLHIKISTRDQSYDINTSEYLIHNIKYNDSNHSYYMNGNYLFQINPAEIDNSYPISIFATNYNNEYSGMSKIRLYSLNIYDHSLSDPNDQDSSEVGYVRYYYPAKSKSGNVIGLYDAVSKTFVTTGGSDPFVNPTDDKVIHFQIGEFIENGIDWITDILEFVIEEPMILMFMAIGLCGVAFRWARRVVHF